MGEENEDNFVRRRHESRKKKKLKIRFIDHLSVGGWVSEMER